MIFIDFHGFALIFMDFQGYTLIFVDFHEFHGFRRFSLDLIGSGTRMSEPLWQPENPCASGLDPPNIKISDSGGLDLEAWCLDAWMLAGLEWIGGGDGGDAILWGDWKKFSHA